MAVSARSIVAGCWKMRARDVRGVLCTGAERACQHNCRLASLANPAQITHNHRGRPAQ